MAIKDIDRGWRRLGSMLKRQKMAQPHVKAGVMGPAATAAHAASEKTTVEIGAYHEFGRGVPERSFIRQTFDLHRMKYNRVARIQADRVLCGMQTPRKSLEILGQMMESDFKRRIEAGIPPSLKDATVKRKGSSKQLVDTGQLKGSITYSVGDV